MLRVLFYSVTICSAIYLFVGLTVYATFGPAVMDNFASNFDEDDLWIVVVRLMMAASVTFTYPLIVLGARQATFDLLVPGRQMTCKARFAITTGICGLCLVVAELA